eukprot:1155638-Pelagomonas_calceolata.AAC.2
MRQQMSVPWAFDIEHRAEETQEQSAGCKKQEELHLRCWIQQHCEGEGKGHVSNPALPACVRANTHLVAVHFLWTRSLTGLQICVDARLLSAAAQAPFFSEIFVARQRGAPPYS